MLKVVGFTAVAVVLVPLVLFLLTLPLYAWWKVQRDLLRRFGSQGYWMMFAVPYAIWIYLIYVSECAEALYFGICYTRGSCT